MIVGHFAIHDRISDTPLIDPDRAACAMFANDLTRRRCGRRTGIRHRLPACNDRANAGEHHGTGEHY